MPVENNPQYPSQLDKTWPLDTDTRREGAEHIRNSKTCLKNYAKKLNGLEATEPVLSMVYPLGALLVGNPTSNSNPGDDLGGTWEYAGKIAIDQTGKGPNVPVWPELWVWVRAS